MELLLKLFKKLNTDELNCIIIKSVGIKIIKWIFNIFSEL